MQQLERGRPRAWLCDSPRVGTWRRTRAGAAETTSPAIRSSGMGVEQSDTFVILKPKLEWRTAQTEAGLIEAYKQALDQSVPGITQSWAQPIEMRMDDLLQGVMADLAIVIHGTDTATLHDLADQVARVVSGVPGAGDVQRDPH